MQIESFNRFRVIGNYMRCCIHCLVPYMVYNHGMWFFQAEPSTKFAEYIIFILHAFIMEAFMFISGYFGAQKSHQLAQVLDRILDRFVIPALFSGLITIPLLYALKAIYQFGHHDILSHTQQLFMADVKQNGLPIVHYWFIWYVVLFTLITYLLPFKNSLLALLCIGLGLTLNPEAMIRNPIYLGINWPSFFYYLGYFLLGNVWSHKKEFDNLGKTWLWGIIFVLNLSLSGYYIMAYQEGRTAFLDHLLQPFFFGACALSGCIFFIRVLENSTIRFSSYQIESSYFIYLFHLPIAIAVQLAFKSYGLQYPWVPLAVILLSLGLVHALNIAFSRFFFESCKQATLRMPWKSHLKKN